MAHRLDPLLRPASIAVLGATERPGTVGRTSSRTCCSGGFAGPLYAVNPGYARPSAACRAFRSLAALPEPVEHVDLRRRR